MTAIVDAPLSGSDLSTKRCIRIKTNGQQCKLPPVNGATVCRSHGGSAPQIQRKALVRATLQEWGINEEHVDPGEVLLRLVSQSARRAHFYGELLRQAYQAEENKGTDDEFGLPRGVEALIGIRYTAGNDGTPYPVDEAIRGLVDLEMRERKVCADFASRAITAGLAERQVRLAEQTAAAVMGAIMVALDRAGIVGPARLEAQNAAADYLLEVEAS